MAEYTLKAKLIADASSLEKNFAKAQASLQDFNNRMKSIGGSISAVGSKLTSSITKPALLATSALAGITMVKGFNRLTGIDDARAKLKALRFDAAEVENIMNSALESVKGTSYGLDEAATTAANAVAAGIKPGKDLTKYLTMTSDAAAIAGMSMSEMGSIINKVQTGQTAYTEDLEQLADRGLPIYQWLGEEAGVAAGEVKKLASDGQISSEMLFNAIEKNVGGAAKIIGENSFTAALANIGASISRIGANFLDAGGKGGGFFSQLKPLMADFNESLGTLEGKAAEMGEKFGAAFGEVVTKVQALKDKFDALSPTAQSALLKTAAAGTVFAVGIGPALSVVGGGIEKVGVLVNGLSGIFGGMKAPLGSFNDGLKALGKETPNLKSNLTDLGMNFGFFKDSVGQSFSETMPILSGGLQDVSSKLRGGKSAISTVLGEMGSNFKAAGSSIFGGFANTAKKIIPNSIQTLGSDIGGAFSAVLPNISTGLSGLGQSISKFGPMFLSSFSSLFKFGAIAGLVVAGFGLLQDNFGTQIQAFITNITSEESMEKLKGFGDKIVNTLLGTQEGVFRQPGLIEKGAQLIMTIINGITTALPMLLQVGIQILSALVTGIGQQLPTLLPAAVQMIITLVMSLTSPENINNIINAGLALIVGLAQGLIGAIPHIISAIPVIIQNILTGILSNLPKLLETGIALIVELGVGLIRAIPDLLGMLPQIFMAIFNAFREVDWLDLGKNIVTGIMDGLAAMGSALWEAVQKLGENIWNGIKDFFHIQSPSRLMRDTVGVMIARGIGDGILKGSKYAVKAVTAVGDNVIDSVTTMAKNVEDIPVVLKQETALASTAKQPLNSSSPTGSSDGVGTNTSNGSANDIQKTALTIGSINADLGNTLLADTTAYTAASQSQWSQMETGITDSAGKMNAQVSAAYSAFSMDYQTQTVTLKNNVLSNWTLMRNMVVQIAKEMGVQATSLFNQLASSVIAIMSALPPKMRTIGSSAMGELQTGINASRGGPLNEASSLVNDLLNVFIEGLGIHSPSKAMEWIGEMMAAGLIKGLSSEQIDKFTLSIIDKMQNSFTNGSLDVGKVVDRLGDNVPELVAKLGVDPSQAQALAYPLIGTLGELTSYFGPRPASDTNGIGSTNHGGIDLAASTGTPIAALASGLVTIAGWYGGYGNAVQIDHGNGMSSLYGHMSSVGVSVGQQVGTGQTIGAVGSTGNSTGPHLHLSMFQDGVAVDPLPYIQGGQMMGNTLASALMAAYNMRKYGLGSDNNGAGGGLDNWLMQALAITGQGMNNLSALRYIAMMESGGDPNAINLWDSNAAAGHPSKGLMQTIDSTFGAYALPGMNDIWNPVHNTVAAIRYMIDRYGGIGNHPGLGSGGYVGYAIGTSCVPQDMLAMIHEGEGIIPADEMKELNRLMNPVNPYRNSGGPVLPNLGISFAETNGQTIGKNISGGFRSGFDTLFSSIMKTAERSMNLSGTSEWFDDAAYGLDKGSRRRVPDIKVEVTSVMDGRKVGYGSARYVNEKNTFDEKRRNRIGGIV